MLNLFDSCLYTQTRYEVPFTKQISTYLTNTDSMLSNSTLIEIELYKSNYKSHLLQWIPEVNRHIFTNLEYLNSIRYVFNGSKDVFCNIFNDYFQLFDELDDLDEVFEIHLTKDAIKVQLNTYISQILDNECRKIDNLIPITLDYKLILSILYTYAKY